MSSLSLMSSENQTNWMLHLLNFSNFTVDTRVIRNLIIDVLIFLGSG
uniref:Uncharacterized protein n=1 Tax=Arundo donax TaxID=35708 RepID=A0A0A9AHZ3_ARUDO